MQLHPRELVVREAERKITDVVLEATKDLTEGETIRVLIHCLSGQLGSMAKFMIREERHGNTDKPGGLVDG